MSRKVNTSYTPAQVKGAFKVFERDCPSGFVSMAALEQALTTYGSEKLSLNDAQELLSQIEPDDNGMVNYVEFVNMMCAHLRPRTPRPHHRSQPTHPRPIPSLVLADNNHQEVPTSELPRHPWQDRIMMAEAKRWTRASVCLCALN